MKKVDVSLKRVALPRFQLNSSFVEVGIFFESNSNLKSFRKKYIINDTEKLVKEIIGDIKKREKPANFLSDNILECISIVNFVNEEKAEEKLMHFFGRFKDRVKNFKNNRYANNHINRFHDLQNQECVI